MNEETISKIEIELSKKLSPEHVKTREGGGNAKLSYLEGWKVIEEANRIFGHLGWSRETMCLEMVGDVFKYEKNRRDMFKIGYRCTVRVIVRDRSRYQDIVRYGTGFGNGIGYDPVDIHELAMKEAETDAMKRALATFGYPLGLALYDKQQTNVGVDNFANEQQQARILELLESATDKTRDWFVAKYGYAGNVPGNIADALIAQLQKTIDATAGGNHESV